MEDERAEAVLRFWFGEPGTDPPSEMWFRKDGATDRHIRDAFGEDLACARSGELDHWARTPRGALALVILLDQMSRNVHRDSPEAFAADGRAQKVTLDAVEQGLDRQLEPLGRAFLYMPLMHSESRALHARSEELFGRLAEEAPPELEKTARSFLKFARSHRAVVERFGRYPHRNRVLGRTTTPEEEAHLKDDPGW